MTEITDFNIYSSSLLFKTIPCVDGPDNMSRAMAVYFPNITEFIFSQNREQPKPTIYIEVMVEYPHLEFGDEPARKESYRILKDIKYTLQQKKNLACLIPDEDGLLETFQIGYFKVKNIEPLQLGSFNKNFATCISLMELEIFTS